jgi:hypothetical protein
VVAGAGAPGAQAAYLAPGAATGAAPGAATGGAIDAAIAQALEVSRASDFRMETLVLVYLARFELGRGDVAAARAAAEAALARATDRLRENPFDEILARRVLAEIRPGAQGVADLSRAVALAERTQNVLQEGIARHALADQLWDTDRPTAIAQLAAAEQRFTAARADRWLRRVQERRAGVTGC